MQSPSTQDKSESRSETRATVPPVLALIAGFLFLSGVLLLIAALLGTEIGRAEVALAAFFLSALVLVLPAIREITIGTGGMTLRWVQAEREIRRTRSAQLLRQAVWSGGDFWFLTPDGRFRLPDPQTAKFLASAGNVLRDIVPEELDAFPLVANLNSVRDAKFVKREDSSDLFFIFTDENGHEYKAHIGSPSLLIDLRPDEKVPPDKRMSVIELHECTTLR
jgi:hypothetical protein